MPRWCTCLLFCFILYVSRIFVASRFTCVWFFVYAFVFCISVGCLICDALLFEPFLHIYVFVAIICTLWAYFPCPNHFLNDFNIFIDLENVGVVTKLCLKNGFCSQVMCKNLSDPKYPTRTFFLPDPTRQKILTSCTTTFA